MRRIETDDGAAGATILEGRAFGTATGHAWPAPTGLAALMPIRGINDRRGAIYTLPQLRADRPWRDAARACGLVFDTLDTSPGRPRRMPYHRLAGALRSGLLAHDDGSLTFAPRLADLHGLARLVRADRRVVARVRVTSPARLAAYIRHHHGMRLARHAAFHLRRQRPALSAGTLGPSRLVLAIGATALALAALGSAFLPGAVQLAGGLLVTAALLGWTLLRASACLLPPRPRWPLLSDDSRLPCYSVIVPLYREARILPKLIAGLRRLDYPADRLQVLLAIEDDDFETLAAAHSHSVAGGFEIVPVPAVGPRTKPKALNVALAHARGPLVAIFDAEDEPEPGQLRAAAHAFARDRRAKVGCVQARLVIDNARDSWLARQFAAEYAAHFDVLLPMLAAWGLPFPLGGTSNHFRLSALEAVGGWDPYNVTEDADLGVRLGRDGWRMAMIGSYTLEEAPAGFAAWLRQRTRWYKGWLQTVLVHARSPRATLAELGARESAILGLLLGGGLATALIHPFFLAALMLRMIGAEAAPSSFLDGMMQGVGIATLVAGYGATALFTSVGMRRRDIPGKALVLPLIPLYWLILSLAAWRALGQLIYAPHHWEKTEHGLARTSLRAYRLGRAAPLPDPIRGSGEARRRPLVESA